MKIKPFLFVKDVEGKGRGVFTKEPIPKGTKIEESPVIVLSKKDTDETDKTRLHDYLFLWGERQVKTCVALGYCSVYNHSYEPNCDHEMDFEKETMSIKTRREIKKGEELSINYNGELKDKSPLWFKVK
ncbi:MAG TPA: SET domain-containing protein [Chitinophagaceae bacterium]|nr:SET domain-containing protein [Chitinophagaceae bacterium]